MWWFKTGLLSIIVALLAWGFYNLVHDKGELAQETQELQNEVDLLQEENSKLLADIEYYSHPENLLKELKSQFNYKESGEKLIILVPQENTSSTQ